MLVGLEREPELVVEDSQVAVPAAHDGSGRDLLHFLRHHANIDGVASLVDEAIEADAIGKVAE